MGGLNLKHFHFLWIVCGVSLFLAANASADSATALDRYVAAKDPTFDYHERSSVLIGKVEISELQMVSQTWRGTSWKHRLFILKPDTPIRPSQAVLIVAGGAWKEDYESLTINPQNLPRELLMFIAAAEQLGSIVAVVTHVPFQPMYDGRKEDDLIAYTMDRYLETGDETWPLLLPMVKSATSAMDVTQAYAQEKWGVAIDHFTVSGASKRGWTTWLTGAVDNRVNAIVPIVIDMLNVSDQMSHQVDVWGNPSQMIQSYADLGIIDRRDTPRGKALWEIVDPYSYRNHLEGIQKTIVLGTNDAYWPVDAANLYWDGLAGDKTLVYAPNAGHGMESGVARVIGSLIATHLAAADDLKLPRPSWRSKLMADGHRFDITSQHALPAATLWWADSSTRDFREARWQSRPVSDVAESFVIDIAYPDSGFRATYVSLAYPDMPAGFEVATQISVLCAVSDPAVKAVGN
jgi:PhoPQ-activated pathogenicity-related protein